MSVDKHTEYESLRQEILDSITSRDNYIIGMYTITVAILCVAFELQNPILFLIPYIILFAFQNSIASKSENMIVLSAYISVFLEEGNGWETNNVDLKKKMHTEIPYKRLRSIWSRIIGRIGSVQLGLLCSISCIIYSLVQLQNSSGTNETVSLCVYIILAIVFYICIRVFTKEVLNLGARKKSYIKNLYKVETSENVRYID